MTGNAVVVTFDPTEVDNPTWGIAAASVSTWTFDTGGDADEPVMLFGVDHISIHGLSGASAGKGTTDPNTPDSILRVTGIDVCLEDGTNCLATTAATHTLLDATSHTDTLADTPSVGSLIIGVGSTKWDELTIGTASQYLRMDGTPTTFAWTNLDISNDPAPELGATPLKLQSAQCLTDTNNNEVLCFQEDTISGTFGFLTLHNRDLAPAPAHPNIVFEATQSSGSDPVGFRFETKNGGLVKVGDEEVLTTGTQAGALSDVTYGTNTTLLTDDILFYNGTAWDNDQTPALDCQDCILIPTDQFDTSGPSTIATAVLNADVIVETDLGLGLVLNADNATADIDLVTTWVSSGDVSTNASGLEITAGTANIQLGLLQGCTDNQILKWDAGDDTWDCEADAGAGSSTWIFQGDSPAGTVTVDTTETVDIAGTGGVSTGVVDGTPIQMTITCASAVANGSTKGCSTYATADFVDNGSGLITLKPTVAFTDAAETWTGDHIHDDAGDPSPFSRWVNGTNNDAWTIDVDTDGTLDIDLTAGTDENVVISGGGTPGLQVEGNITARGTALCNIAGFSTADGTTNCTFNIDTKCIGIQAPSTGTHTNIMWFRTNEAITVTEMNCITVGSGSPTATIDILECDSAGANCGSSRISNTLASCSTSGVDDSSISDPEVPANSWFRMSVTAVTNAPEFVTACMTFAKN